MLPWGKLAVALTHALDRPRPKAGRRSLELGEVYRCSPPLSRNNNDIVIAHHCNTQRAVISCSEALEPIFDIFLTIHDWN